MADVVLRGEPLEMVTTDPARSARPRPSAARIRARVGQVLIRTVSRSCASVMASKLRGNGAPPTVLTSRSMPPNASTARPTSASAADSVSIGPTTPITSYPSAPMARTAESSRSWSRPLMTTDAPSRASRMAHDRPMLGSAVDPVTMATLPVNRCSAPSLATVLLAGVGSPVVTTTS